MRMIISYVFLAVLLVFAWAVNAGPNVAIKKACPDLRYLDRPVTFEITVTNNGDAPALDVVVRDRVTGGVRFVSADNDGVREGNDVVWRLGTLDAGQARTLKTTMRCTQIGTVKNEATVNYCAEAMAACEFPVKGRSAILLECVDQPDPIEIGEELTYTITVLNQGTAVGTNIVMDCTLPKEQEYVRSTGPTEAKVDGKSVKFAPLKELQPKATAVFTVRVKGVAEGDVRFGVELTSDQLTRPVMETESTHIY